MIVYLASCFSTINSYVKEEKEKEEILRGLYVLDSFAYANEKNNKYIPLLGGLMVDSGAFTIMTKSLKGKNLGSFSIKEYTKKYAEYVKKLDLKNFIEMDIEGHYGFDVYRDCLHMLQDITGKDPIYVYHKWRGLDYYRLLVQKKNYVMLGDVAVISKNDTQEKFFRWFLDEAHKYNCRVHGLAFTKINKLRMLDFDSVDSSTFSEALRFGCVHRFNGHDISKYDAGRSVLQKEGLQFRSPGEIAVHQVLEWKKLQKVFAEQYESL